MKSKKNGVVVGTVGEYVFATSSNRLEALAADTVARHLGMVVDYHDPAGWVALHQNGSKAIIEPYYSLRDRRKVAGPYREGFLYWEGQYRLTPIA